jgi:hypothetical protein
MLDAAVPLQHADEFPDDSPIPGLSRYQLAGITAMYAAGMSLEDGVVHSQEMLRLNSARLDRQWRRCRDQAGEME